MIASIGFSSRRTFIPAGFLCARLIGGVFGQDVKFSSYHALRQHRSGQWHGRSGRARPWFLKDLIDATYGCLQFGRHKLLAWSAFPHGPIPSFHFLFFTLCVHTISYSDALFADVRQHGNWIYDLPSGWIVDTFSRDDGAQQLQLRGTKERLCETCWIRLGPGGPAQGPLEDWLHLVGKRFVKQESLLTAFEIQPPRKFPGYEGVASTVYIVDQRLYHELAFDAGDRFELLTFSARVYDDAEFDKAVEFWSEEVLHFLNGGIQFVSEGGQSVLPPAEPGDLEGLYWGWGWDKYSEFYLTSGIQDGNRLLFFWRDGYFYNGTPPKGTTRLNSSALRGSASRNWGVYIETGPGNYNLRYSDGRTEVLRHIGVDDPLFFARATELFDYRDPNFLSSRGLSDGRQLLIKVEPLPDGTQLSGKISTSSWGKNNAIPGMDSSVSTSQSTTLYSDGRYNSELFGGIIGSFHNPALGRAYSEGVVSGHDQASSSGTYEVRDGLIVNYPSNGGQPTAEFAFFGRNGAIMIGGYRLK